MSILISHPPYPQVSMITLIVTGGRIISARRMTLREVSSRSIDVSVPTSRPSRPVIRTKALSLNSEKRTLGRVMSLDQVLEGLHLQGASHAQPFLILDEEAESDPFDLPRCTSPISDRICDGNCPESPTLKPEVVRSCTIYGLPNLISLGYANRFRYPLAQTVRCHGKAIFQ